jgi:glycosyltransferase involved in cell wall biosynthesis
MGGMKRRRLGGLMKVVVCAEVSWQYVRTRKQQLLSRFPSDWPILFLQPWARGRRNAWWPQRDGRMVFATVPVMKNAPNRLVRTLLARILVRALANVVLFVWVWLLRRRTGFGGSDVALYVSNIYFGSVLPHLQRRFAVYDCNDNHLAFPGTPAWARGYLARVVREVDAVVVSQPLLREDIERFEPRAVHEIGNGVDYELFDAAWRQPSRPPEICTLPAPRIGYAGALAEWIDFELLGRIADRYPAASVVLIGPQVGLNVDPREFAGARSNVHWLRAKPHAQLPHYVAEMDVCLIPFRLTPLTRGVNPNKLYEYLALGKPVVSSDFSPWLRQYEPHVRIGTGAEEFLAQVETALTAPGEPEPRRRVAAEHRWELRAQRMVGLFEDLWRAHAEAAHR